MANTTVFDMMKHLSLEACTRKPNPMKEILRWRDRNPNAVTLANGNVVYHIRCHHTHIWLSKLMFLS